ncbi:efflux RND transporter permease subunit [Neptunomonas sp.]|uniref:efflux RND transporter permease subunit n=1 Tax=Neptunomonas sp. TaxID=1971898 RepID=UPI0035689182
MQKNASRQASRSFIDRAVAYSLSGSLPVLIIVLSLFMGGLALNFTAREEEPQIVVPMVDISVQAPAISAQQVERQVTFPLEKLLAQIPGVEHVYSRSMSGQALVTLRFYVGEDREDAIFNTYNKLYSNQDNIPAGVSTWQVNPIEVDDVPILMLGLWTDLSEPSVSDYQLKRVADEFANYLQAITNTSEVKVVGGRARNIRILLQPESLAARQSTAMDVLQALQLSNVLKRAGYWTLAQSSVQLESGDVLRDLKSLQQLVVNVVDGVPVFLQDVASIEDGPEEANSYTWIDFAATKQGEPQSAGGSYPMVALSIAKKPGSNAVTVAQEVHALIDDLKVQLLPGNVYIETLRDYGQTANEKVTNLTNSLLFAVFTVVVFIAIFLGWRPAVVVGIAVPISYGVTLALDMAFGYTINRVTLFAMILSLGLLVDDPITGVDNIQRFLKKHATDPAQDKLARIQEAIAEIKIPLIMSTITIILAFIPLAFITGMMGPYMAPMAFNVPVSVIVSTLVAFLVTPWLARKILRVHSSSEDGSSANGLDPETATGLYRFYHKLLMPFFTSRRKSKIFLWTVLLLFIAAAMLPMMRWVPLKLLPFDNKNEVQVIIDMPESSTLEQTATIAKQISQELLRFNEVEAVASFVGVPSPIDFNGMVRHYYQRQAPYQADLRLTLLDRALREHQSHAVVLRMREHLAVFSAQQLKQPGLRLKVVEVPPGPPVLSTLVVEITGSALTSYEDLQAAAKLVEARLQREPFVVEVDSSIEDAQTRLRFETDKTLAALSGISTQDVNQTLMLVTRGIEAGYFQTDRETESLPIILQLPLAERSALQDIERLQVKGRAGVVKASSQNGLDSVPQPLVSLGELGEFITLQEDTSIQHKNLQRVVYVMAELSGRTPAEVIADVSADLNTASITSNANEVTAWQERNFIEVFLGNAPGDSWHLPEDAQLNWGGEGEWLITIDVFRDMGLAFLFALVGIFFVLKLQTDSTRLALIIISAIPLTVIGIMPGFAILNLFGERMVAGSPDPVLFTATAMIGMIALAGIVVRNSLILVEFITQARKQGAPIKDALVMAGAVRMRPVLLTAGTTILGNLVIILDPVFSGLALAIIFGIIASTLFTLVLVPIVYFLVFDSPQSELIEREDQHATR